MSYESERGEIELQVRRIVDDQIDKVRATADARYGDLNNRFESTVKLYRNAGALFISLFVFFGIGSFNGLKSQLNARVDDTVIQYRVVDQFQDEL